MLLPSPRHRYDIHPTFLRTRAQFHDLAFNPSRRFRWPRTITELRDRQDEQGKRWPRHQAHRVLQGPLGDLEGHRAK